MTRTDARHKAKVQKPHRIGNTFAHSASDATCIGNKFFADMRKITIFAV